MTDEERLEELLDCWEQTRTHDNRPTPEDLCRDCPELLEAFRRRLQLLARVDGFLQDSPPPPQTPPTTGGPPSPAANQAKVPSLDLRGYELAERLGAGGMGEVYRAADPALGRDLAVKVMKAKYQGNEEAEQRFLREARITGSLQHPGIVPVHNLGRLADGRLHYTMRLVRGRTLADILRGDAGKPERLAGLLTVFEKVCQAVAYAHSKRVIHRDLKPANVMVGAFGEVQVMDWGLAKVLASEDGPVTTPDDLARPRLPTERDDTPEALSRIGAGMGTPAYMPPEQARGEWDTVDERADVFALGALLCKVLTGRSPYEGDKGNEVWQRVRRGDVSKAMERLGEWGADAELTVLCRECLAPAAEGRPRHAGVVAERIAAYQVGVQERLRLAELERARAQVKAQEERRRRRLAVALAAAVVVLAVLLAGGAVLAVVIRDRVAEANRQTQVAGLVNRLLDADIAGLPEAVRALDDFRRWADPLLAKALAEADDDPRRLRASLALLPVDGSQADYLFGRLLDAAPAEVPVLVPALRPYSAARREELWGVAQRPEKGHEARRLRAACALAAYDPDTPLWEVVGPAVVRQVVAENDTHLAVWIDGFRPIKDKLQRSLRDVFRDRSEGRDVERRMAANFLAAYADRPEALADLLAEADVRQFAVLYPKLAGHGEAALAPLNAELDKQAAHTWDDQPLDPSWRAPDTDLVRQIEAAGGLVDERFALFQTLPLAQLGKVAEELRPCGYRPIRLRPFAQEGWVLVAAVWTRDGHAWLLDHGLSAAEARARKDDRRKQGWDPVDVAGYLDGEQERYAVVWARAVATGGPPVATNFRPPSGTDSDWYVGVPEAQHQASGWGPLHEAQRNAQTVQTFVGADGELRFSSVWRALPGAQILWGTDERTKAGRGLSEAVPVDISLAYRRQYVCDVQAELLAWLSGSPWAGLALRSDPRVGAHPERRYARTFFSSADMRFDHQQVLGLSSAAHRERCRELARQGYRPAAIAVASFPAPESLVAASVWHRPVIAEDAKEQLAQRQANAAVALLRLGQAGRLWPLLKHQHDPRLRSYLIHRLSPLGADPKAIVRRLAAEHEDSSRRALLLCLGEFGQEQLSLSEREELVPELERLYRDHPDPGLHAAAEWLMRKWDQGARITAIDREFATGEPAGGRRWYVGKQGQTFVLLDGKEFTMGSPPTEAGRMGGPEGTVETRHRRRIGRTFALAAHEVTVAHYLCFRQDHPYNKPQSPGPDCPINEINWYDAAEYCNWLSAQEDIPKEEWCYAPGPKGFAEGMRPRPGFLDKCGYRLPTEAEWEYACRAGAITSRYFGASGEREMLGQYAWYIGNSPDACMPVGSLKPNDFGLFDMLGNAREWVQNPFDDYREGKWQGALDDRGDPGILVDRATRMLRGGAATERAFRQRAADRVWAFPPTRMIVSGFRPARTFRSTPCPAPDPRGGRSPS